MGGLSYNKAVDLLAFFLVPSRIFSIVDRFTFTDVEDFLPLFSLFLGLIGVRFIHRSAKNQDKVSRPLMLLLLVLTLWPILPNFGLFFLAREFQSVNGHWPQVMMDDPRNWYGHVSPRFDKLSHTIGYLEAFSGAWLLIFMALFVVVRGRLSARQRRLCIGLLCFTVFLCLADPGNLHARWLD